MKTLLVLAFLSAVPAWAATTGFTAGNDLTATPIRAEISVHCNEAGQSDIGYFSCSQTVLDPAEYSYFVTDAGGDADSVTLTATWENGKTVTKKEDFDPATGKSKDSFNLWIETLFQRPLLNMGTNKVHYVLSKGNATRSEGDFVATVREGAPRQCRDGFVGSSRLDDCRTGYNACTLYFAQENYCQ